MIDQLVLANRILYDQGVVDGLGHVNVPSGRAVAVGNCKREQIGDLIVPKHTRPVDGSIGSQ